MEGKSQSVNKVSNRELAMGGVVVCGCGFIIHTKTLQNSPIQRLVVAAPAADTHLPWQTPLGIRYANHALLSSFSNINGKHVVVNVVFAFGFVVLEFFNFFFKVLA